jgi:O-antigen ligase
MSESVGSALVDRPWSELELGRFPLTLGLAGLTCALIPAYVVRWHVAFYPTTLLEAAIVLTVLAFAFESWRQGATPVWRTPVTYPAIVFAIAGAISVFVSPDHRAALGIYRAYLLEPIAFALVLVNVLDNFPRARVVLAGLGLAGIVVAIANSVVILNALRHHQVSPGVTGPVTIFTNANDIPLFLVPLIAVAGAIALHGRDSRLRIACVVFLLVAVPAVLLSFSRGGYLALAAVAFGLALSHRYRWRLVGAAAVAGIAIALVPPIRHRLGVEIDFSNPQNTLVGRFELWRVSLRMLRDHIPLGAGLSGFAQTIAPYWNPSHTDRFIYPHNIVLTFWSETGLLGLAAFTWLMVVGFSVTWRGWRKPHAEWGPLELGVLLALVAVVVHGLVDVPYFKNDLALTFWALIGLAVAGSTTRLAWPRRDPARRSL